MDYELDNIIDVYVAHSTNKFVSSAMASTQSSQTLFTYALF